MAVFRVKIQWISYQSPLCLLNCTLRFILLECIFHALIYNTDKTLRDECAIDPR